MRVKHSTKWRDKLVDQPNAKQLLEGQPEWMTETSPLLEEAELVTEVDYWRCTDGRLHQWIYRGKVAQSYRCLLCDIVVKKVDLKEATDTDG